MKFHLNLGSLKEKKRNDKIYFNQKEVRSTDVNIKDLTNGRYYGQITTDDEENSNEGKIKVKQNEKLKIVFSVIQFFSLLCEFDSSK